MKMLKTLEGTISLYQLFLKLEKTMEAVLLDSSLESGDRGRYSILACRPYLTIEENDGICYVNGEAVQETFTQYVGEYLQEHREENPTGLPLTAGAVGYFSYDYGREKEGVRSQHKKELDIPECLLKFYDCFLIEDHLEHRLTIAANGKTEEPDQVIREMEAVLENTEIPTASSETAYGTNISRKTAGTETAKGIRFDNPVEDTVFRSSVEADFSQKDYQDAVDHMIRYIVDGDIYVVNMTHQLRISSDCPPEEMFRRLRHRNPSPFGAYLDYGDFQIVCASPERFMQMKDGRISTRPIKGTRKRGATKEEDLVLKEELAHSEKDQSELLMIVDLERNDLNRVCVPGSVQVTELFQVETYATVFHLESNVVGKLKPENNAMDLIRAAFPGGSITGAPKLRAMELIDQEERSRRNLYTGSIGYLSLNGDCDLNIVIRTAVHKDGVYHLGVGGGITCESELEFEYEETWQKAKALLQALDAKPLKGDVFVHRVREEKTGI